MGDASGNAWSARPLRKQLTVSITLECGHSILMRTAPLNRNTRYPCQAGENCGYNVRWKKYNDGRFTKDNPLTREDRE